MKALIFDLDGTIADTFPVALAAANKVNKKWGKPPIKDTLALRSKGMREIIKEDIKLNFFTLPFYVKAVKIEMAKNINKAKIFLGISKIINQLAKKYKIGIVTSNSKTAVRHLTKGLNISFIHSDSSMFGKHRILNRLMKTHKLKPQNVIYVGDEVRDVEACKKAGIRVAAVLWGYNSEKALKRAKPDFIVSKPSDLLKITP